MNYIVAIISIILYCLILLGPAWGQTVIGQTIIPACPSAAVINRILEQGETIGADYTEFLRVEGQEHCPANQPFDVLVCYEDEICTRRLQGVTIGMHYKME